MSLKPNLALDVVDTLDSKAWSMSFSPPAKVPGSAGLRRQSYTPKEQWRILKNLLMMGSAFALLFTAFMATANLQSSVNAEGNLGVYSLASIYGAFLLSSLFLPSYLLAKLKTKGTLVVSIVGYVTYMGAQFYPSFYTLIPASLVIGISASGLWTSQSNYVTKISEEYANIKGLTSETVSQWFFGFFFLCFHSSQVWGNLISSFVLSSTDTTNTTGTLATNYSHCGAHFCPAKPPSAKNVTLVQNLTNDTAPDEDDGVRHQMTILTGIFLACSIVAAFVIILGVDSLKRYGEEETNLYKAKWYALLLATVNHWRDPKQLLLIPLATWVGIQEAFLGAEFTLSFVSCAWGIHQIGFVMTALGVAAATSSMLIGRITTLVGRPAVFILAAGLNAASFLTMLFWEPNTDQKYVFFVVAAMWGAADGVWSPQVRAIYGTIFVETREAAFSNVGLWLSIGFIIVYVNAAMLCMSLKIYIYLGFLAVTLSTYLTVEMMYRKNTT